MSQHPKDRADPVIVAIARYLDDLFQRHYCKFPHPKGRVGFVLVATEGYPFYPAQLRMQIHFRPKDKAGADSVTFVSYTYHLF